MKINEKKLRQILDDYVMSGAELARDMGVDVSEVEKMLNGETVGKSTAKKFIAYFGATKAGRLFDWDALGKNNPLADEPDDGADDTDGEV